MSGHTPGPWDVKGPCGRFTRPGIDGGRGNEYHSIIIMGTEESECGIDTIENARLIAAAPDSNAVCVALDNWWHSRQSRDELERIVIMAKEAIAKAGGKE